MQIEGGLVHFSFRNRCAGMIIYLNACGLKKKITCHLPGTGANFILLSQLMLKSPYKVVINVVLSEIRKPEYKKVI